jgi:dCMP deaminase
MSTLSTPNIPNPTLPRTYAKTTVFLEIADLLGQLGTCDRAKVGALIVKDGRCISWGYNGAPPGQPHCSANLHGWIDKIDWDPWREAGDVETEAYALQWIEEHGCNNVTHAEANAVAFAARQGISTENGTLYTAVSPCLNCSRLLIAAGIVRVVFRKMYRDQAGVQLLHAAGVKLVGG